MTFYKGQRVRLKKDFYPWLEDEVITLGNHIEGTNIWKVDSGGKYPSSFQILTPFIGPERIKQPEEWM